MPTLIDVLSNERFDTYRQWAGGDEPLAIRLYTFNVQLSAALYSPLHILEVALRNVIDRRLTAVHGPIGWTIQWSCPVATSGTACSRRAPSSFGKTSTLPTVRWLPS